MFFFYDFIWNDPIESLITKVMKKKMQFNSLSDLLAEFTKGKINLELLKENK